MRNNLPFNCRTCPSGKFEIKGILKYEYRPSRFMGVCNCLNVVIHPQETDNGMNVINKDNINDVTFEPVENCPSVQNLISEGKIPWAMATIDFLK